MWTSAADPSVKRMQPPFSPVLLAGLALAPVPPKVLQPAFSAVLAVIRSRHPDILDRLSDYADARVCIDPVDLPFVLMLEPDPLLPRLTVHRSLAELLPTAVVRGSLAALVALTEGKVDGDALFFSRQLVIEGDTEVVVALRNAVDGAGIDLIADVAAALGPFGRLFAPAARGAGRLFGRITAHLDVLRQSLVAPAVQNADAQAARITDLEAEVAALRRGARKGARA